MFLRHSSISNGTIAISMCLLRKRNILSRVAQVGYGMTREKTGMDVYATASEKESDHNTYM